MPGEFWRTIPGVICLLFAWNIFVFLRYGWDKLAVRRRWWRVKESELLMLAFLAASPGAKFAQHVFRHKTTKQPFASNLNAIAWVHGIACGLIAALFLIPETRVWLIDLLSQLLSGTSDGGQTPNVTINRGL